MKIIGKSSDENRYNEEFIVTVRKDELAKIMGSRYYEFKTCGELRIGSTVAVDKIFDYLEKVAEADMQIKKAAQVLRAMADLADGVTPMFPPVKEGE